MNQILVSGSRHMIRLAVATLLIGGTQPLDVIGADEGGLKPLPIKFPEPTLRGTPEDLPSGPNIDPPPKQDPPPFLAPEGVKNVAHGKPVTSSVRPFTGELAQLTDGKKEAFDTDAIEMRSGSHWVQVDLGAPHVIYAVALWHDHRYIQITRDVIVQIADDPEFKENVHTIFNNDRDDSSKQGPGTDKEYFETKYGKVVDARGARGRYVRGYSKGTSLTALNCWQELEVYGVPAP
jgi:hypothetical protein